jgi:hypothetical protein
VAFLSSLHRSWQGSRISNCGELSRDVVPGGLYAEPSHFLIVKFDPCLPIRRTRLLRFMG